MAKNLMDKTVSVIIPTYNRGPFLKKAIESVLSQSYQEFELVIVDSHSDDHTPAILEGFRNRLAVLQVARGNPAAARNLGIRSTRYPLIAFLDSDDWWHRDKLSLQIRAMDENRSYLISHTQEVWYSKGKILRQRRKHRKYHGWIFDKCLPLCAVSPSTVITRRELFETVGLFDENFICCEDYELWLRVSAHYPFLLVDMPLTFKDGGREDQMSRIHRVGMDKLRIQALLKILSGPFLLNGEQKILAVRELEKKCRIYGEGCIKHGKIEEGRCYLELPRLLRSTGRVR